MRVSLKQVLFVVTLGIATYSTLELLRLKSLQYEALYKKAQRLEREAKHGGAAAASSSDSDPDDGYDQTDYYDDTENKDESAVASAHGKSKLRDQLKAMQEELESLKGGRTVAGGTKPEGYEPQMSSHETPTYERQGCEVRMADPKEMAIVPLLSFPGSGNTWTRYLIEQVTGMYTGSVYHDGGLYNHGHFRGEMEDAFSGTTIVQKVHRVGSNGWSSRMFRGDAEHRAKHCLFLLRDPRSAFKSEFSRLKVKSHMGRLTQADLEGHYHDEWSKQIDKWIYAYPDCYMAAARGACKDGIHLIFYEKLKESHEALVEEVSKATHFVSRANLLKKLHFNPECLAENGAGGKYDRGTKHATEEVDYEAIFSEKQKRKMNASLKMLNKTLMNALPSSYLFQNVEAEEEDWSPTHRRLSLINPPEPRAVENIGYGTHAAKRETQIQGPAIPADVEEYENGEVEEDSNDSRALIDEEELEDAEEENDSEDMDTEADAEVEEYPEQSEDAEPGYVAEVDSAFEEREQIPANVETNEPEMEEDDPVDAPIEDQQSPVKDNAPEVVNMEGLPAGLSKTQLAAFERSMQGLTSEQRDRVMAQIQRRPIVKVAASENASSSAATSEEQVIRRGL